EAHALVQACTEAGLPVFIPLGGPSLALPPPDIETVGNGHYAVYQPHQVETLPLAAKVGLDRGLAAVFIVLLLPLMLLVALASRLFIGPSVVFVQPRGGLNGKPFRMLKFRTMRLGAEAERLTPDGLSPLEVFNGFKARNDPRITRFGHVLRR